MMTVREEDLEEAVEGRSSEIGIVVEQVKFFRKREYLHCMQNKPGGRYEAGLCVPAERVCK